jgi:DnaJ-class molecular chaperone
MNGQAGKGSRFRPVNLLKYGAEYDRIYGIACSACGGKGYYYDVVDRGKKAEAVKTTCMLCNGTGKAKL